MKRIALALETGFLMFAVCAALALLYFWRLHDHSFRSIVLVIAVPALASLLLVCFAFFVPGLFAPGKLTYPLNFTLPVVHTVLLVACVMLLLTTPNSVELPPEPVRPIGFWLQTSVLLMVLGGECIVLSALSVRGNREPHPR